MLTYSNIQRHDDIPFSDYLKLGGLSHSFLKHAKNGIATPINVSEVMKRGSLVDAMLTEPEKADMSSPLYPACKSIVFEIRNNFGDMINRFEKQVSYTCEIDYKGFRIKSTGRLDFLLPKFAVIDLKITQAKDVPALIKFMGYENQVWHYCKMSKVDKAYLMVYSVPLKKTQIFYYDCSNDYNEFWANKILDYGKVEEVEF